MGALLDPGWWLGGFAQGLGWWLACVVMSLCALPLALRVFRTLPDRGAGFSIGMGPILTTWVAWLLGLEWFGGRPGAIVARCALIGVAVLLLGGGWLALRDRPLSTQLRALVPGAALALAGLVHLPHGAPSIWLSAAMLGCVSAALWWGEADRLKATLRTVAVPLIVAHLVFLLAFVFFLNVRSYIPYATFDPGMSGAEKAGNFTHLNSLMRSESFPPGDAWFLGEPINYYYGGHLVVATIAKATGTPARFAFNFGLATVFGLTMALGFVFTFGLVQARSLSGRIRRFGLHRGLGWGILGAFAIAMFGNVDALHQFAMRDPRIVQPAMETRVREMLLERGGYSDAQIAEEVTRAVSRPRYVRFGRENLGEIDYWRSSRAIKGTPPGTMEAGTITEFPYFTAILGDLHPHHSALPFALLILGACIATMRAGRRMVPGDRTWLRRAAPSIAAMGLGIGLVFPVNIWDAVVLAPLLGLAIMVSLRRVACDLPVWKWIGFAGMTILLSLTIALIWNAQAGMAPVFAMPKAWALAIVAVVAGAWAATTFGTSSKTRLLIGGAAFLAAAALALAGGYVAARDSAAGSELQHAIRDAVLFLVASGLAALWALVGDSPLKRWWSAAGTAYLACGTLALWAILPFKLFFVSPLQTRGSIMASILPPRPDPGLFELPGRFWETFWERSPVNPFPAELRTQFADYITHWGLFFIPVLILLIARAMRFTVEAREGRPFALWASILALLFFAYNAMHFWAGPVAIVLCAVCVLLACTRHRHTEGAVWALLACAFFFQFFVEVLHFDDNYAGAYERYNTPFKLYYPLWPMMAGGMVFALRAFWRWLPSPAPAQGPDALASPTLGAALLFTLIVLPFSLAQLTASHVGSAWMLAFALAWVLTAACAAGIAALARRSAGSAAIDAVLGAAHRVPALLVIAALCAGGMLYPWASTWKRTSDFFSFDIPIWHRGKPEEKLYSERSLDALSHLSNSSQFVDDYAAVEWLLANVEGRPMILEAPGAHAYAPDGRIAGSTGLPTLVGWSHHERQWRGWETPVPTEIASVFARFFTLDDLNARFAAQPYLAEVADTREKSIRDLAALPPRARYGAVQELLPDLAPEDAVRLCKSLADAGAGLTMNRLVDKLIAQGQMVYSAPEFTPEVEAILSFYGENFDLEYLVLGTQEAQLAPSGSAAARKFDAWEKAFTKGGTTVYRVPEKYRAGGRP